MRSIHVMLCFALVAAFSVLGISRNGTTQQSVREPKNSRCRTANAEISGPLRFVSKGQVVDMKDQCGGFRIDMLSKKKAGPLDSVVTDVGKSFIVIRSYVARRAAAAEDGADLRYVAVQRVVPVHAIKEIVAETSDVEKLRDRAKKRILDALEDGTDKR